MPYHKKQWLVLSLVWLLTAPLPVSGDESSEAKVVAEDIAAASASAEALTKKGEWIQAEKAYCDLLTKMQLTYGFEDPHWVPALRQLAVVYKAEGKARDRQDALSLAKDIESGVLPKTYIGTVEMFPDNSITIRKRINGATVFGDAFIHLAKDQTGYTETCRLVGGLSPGQTKVLPPWPGLKDQNSNYREIACGMDTARNQMLLFQHSEYTFVSADGTKTVTTDNSSAKGLALHIAAHALDMAKHNVSHTPEFIDAVIADGAGLSIPDRIKYAYYLQPRFGVEETYASIYEALISQRSSKKASNDEPLCVAFPKSTAVITKQIEAAEASSPAKESDPKN